MRMSSILAGSHAEITRTERAMRSGTDTHLAAFNRQILENQDAAYTLAYYMTGSETLAEETVQNAVLQAYVKSSSNPGGARTALLQAVIGTCRKRPNAPAHSNGSDPLWRVLGGLSQERRCAVLLVDVLGLSYEEAARVLSSTTARVSEWLAQGRVAALSYA